MPCHSPPHEQPSLLPSPFPNSAEQVLAPSSVPIISASIYSQDQDLADEPPLDHNDDEEDGYPDLQEDQGGSLLPPPSFHPFFTLVTDSTNGETYHPATYYIFQDDDPDVLTTATLHALDAQSSRFPEGEGEGEIHAGNTGDEERYLVVDMHGDGTRVKEIKSLSAKWAITGAQIKGAPTFQQEGGAVGEIGGGNEGIMLMIMGTGIDMPVSEGDGKDKTAREMARKTRARAKLEEARKRGQGDVVKGMEELAISLGPGLGILDKIIGPAE